MHRHPRARAQTPSTRFVHRAASVGTFVLSVLTWVTDAWCSLPQLPGQGEGGLGHPRQKLSYLPHTLRMISMIPICSTTPVWLWSLVEERAFTVFIYGRCCAATLLCENLHETSLNRLRRIAWPRSRFTNDPSIRAFDLILGVFAFFVEGRCTTWPECGYLYCYFDCDV